MINKRKNEAQKAKQYYKNQHKIISHNNSKFRLKCRLLTQRTARWNQALESLVKFVNAAFSPSVQRRLFNPFRSLVNFKVYYISQHIPTSQHPNISRGIFVGY